MAKEPPPSLAVRVFKTKHFAKEAKAAGIADAALYKAASELDKGQGDPLGGEVWKKRLNENRYRSIVLTEPGRYWLFVYLFAKKDRENIDRDELVAFKKLSKDYAASPASAWKAMLENGDLKEISK